MLVDMSGNLVVLLCEWNLMLKECNTFFLEGEIWQLNTRRHGGELEYKDMGKMVWSASSRSTNSYTPFPGTRKIEIGVRTQLTPNSYEYTIHVIIINGDHVSSPWVTPKGCGVWNTALPNWWSVVSYTPRRCGVHPICTHIWRAFRLTLTLLASFLVKCLKNLDGEMRVPRDLEAEPFLVDWLRNSESARVSLLSIEN